MTRTDLMALARELVAAGEVTLPLVRNSLTGRFHPPMRGWPELHPDALLDDAESWALATGLGLRGGGHLVADLDARNGASLVDAVRLGFDYGLAISTPRGGLHFHFALPAGAVARSVQGCDSGLTGIDLVAGSSAVLMTPAVPGYTAVREFRWADLVRENLPPAPANLLALVTEAGRASSLGAAKGDKAPHWADLLESSGKRTTDGALEVLVRQCREIRSTAPGGQRAALNRVAFACGRAIRHGCLAPDFAESMLVRAALRMEAGDPNWPWTREHARRLVRDGILAGYGRGS